MTRQNRQTTTVASTAPVPEPAPVAAPEPSKWTVTTFTNRSRAKVPPPSWAYEIVDQTYDNKVALAHTFGSEKEARSALHQIERVVKERGYGLSAQVIGAELRVQAKVKKAVKTAEESAAA